MSPPLHQISQTTTCILLEQETSSLPHMRDTSPPNASPWRLRKRDRHAFLVNGAVKLVPLTLWVAVIPGRRRVSHDLQRVLLMVGSLGKECCGTIKEQHFQSFDTCFASGRRATKHVLKDLYSQSLANSIMKCYVCLAGSLCKMGILYIAVADTGQGAEGWFC